MGLHPGKKKIVAVPPEEGGGLRKVVAKKLVHASSHREKGERDCAHLNKFSLDLRGGKGRNANEKQKKKKRFEAKPSVAPQKMENATKTSVKHWAKKTQKGERGKLGLENLKPIQKYLKRNNGGSLKKRSGGIRGKKGNNGPYPQSGKNVLQTFKGGVTGGCGEREKRFQRKVNFRIEAMWLCGGEG